MKTDGKIPKQHIIDIADFMFANPTVKTAVVIAKFADSLRKSKRSVEGYITKAREYNKGRIIEDEKVKAEARRKHIIEQDETMLMRNRDRALELLWEIAEGKKSDAFGIRTNAIDKIAKYEHFDEKPPPPPEQSQGEREKAIEKIMQKQLEVFNDLFYSDFNYMDLPGGRGRGASFALSSYLVAGVLGDDYFRAVAMRYNDTSISTGIWQDILDRIDEFDLHKFLKVTSVPRKIICLETGNFISATGFVGSKEKMKGLAGYNVVSVDEANEVPEFLINKLLDTIRTVKGKNRVIRAFNPPSKRHYIWKDYVIEPTKGGYTYKPKADTLISAIISSYKDNDYLSESYLQRIEGKRATDENYYFGQYAGLITDNPTGRIFNWNTCTVADFKSIDGNSAYGLDFGFSDDPNALVEIKRHGNKIYLREHIYKSGQSDKQLIDELLLLGIDFRPLIVCDSSADTRIHNLLTSIDGTHEYKKGFNAQPCEKGAGSILDGIGIMKEYELIVCEDSDNLISELSDYNWQIDRDGIVTEKPVDKNNHLIDASRYVISWIKKYGL